MMNFRKSLLIVSAFVALFVGGFAQATGIVIVQHKEAYLGGISTAPFTLLSLNTPPVAGNAIFVQFSSNGGGPLTTITDNYGNTFTLIKAESDSGNSFNHQDVELWWLPVLPGGGSGTYTVSVTPSRPGAGGAPNASVLEVSGLVGTVDKSGAAQDVGGANVSLTVTASGANAAANSLVLSHTATTAASAINEPPNTGYTGTINQYGQLSGGYKIVVATETSSAAWTWTGATWGAAVIATFPAATGAPLAGAATDTVTAAGALTLGTPGPFSPLLLDYASHVNGSDNVGMGTGPGTGTGDSANTAFTKIKQWAADANTNFAKLFQVRSVQTPTTGFTIAAAVGVTQVVLNPAGTLATGTVTLPQTPGDNQPFTLLTSQTITALTINTADATTINGAPSTLSANTAVKFRFITSLNTWFRE